jgi:hypothetical protein
LRDPEEQSRAGTERRAHPRTAVSIPVEVSVSARGVAIAGTTVNLGRGGALVCVRAPIVVGEHCTVHFRMAGPGLVSVVSATAIRSDRIADGHLVALEFDDKLPAAPGLR